MSGVESIPGSKMILPQLPMNLRGKKLSIGINWGLLLTATCILPNALYFGIRYGAHSIDTALTPPTAILGGFTILTFGMRCWTLMRKGSTCRPIGAKWWMADYFHWNILFATILVTAVLASATSDDPPNIRQASMPQSIVLYWASIQVIITGVMVQMGWNTPVRFSSTAAGALARPGVFTLVEDVVAVDGAGDEAFRVALTSRYDASPAFRQLLRHLNWFWGVGSLSVAILTTLIVFLVDDLNVVFALGWTLPWCWAGLAVVATILWAQKALKMEEAEWSSRTVG